MSSYESIYNLIPREAAPTPQRTVFLPKNTEQLVLPCSTFGADGSSRPVGGGVVTKRNGANFGPPNPKLGLTRVHHQQTRTVSSDPFQYTDYRKDQVPTRNEVPLCGVTTKKNFVTSNAVEAILMAPKNTAKKELNYLEKEDYGKVPSYLTQVRQEIERENTMIEKYVKHRMGERESTPEVYEEMDHFEREELLEALKAKWDSVNGQYQRMTHLVKLDTTGQIRRKEALESQLSRLEADIARLEAASDVLIAKY